MDPLAHTPEAFAIDADRTTTQHGHRPAAVRGGALALEGVALADVSCACGGRRRRLQYLLNAPAHARLGVRKCGDRRPGLDTGLAFAALVYVLTNR